MRDLINIITESVVNEPVIQDEKYSLIKQLSEKAPPGKKAHHFIAKHKDEFKDRYGDAWEQVLYATANKLFRKKKLKESDDDSKITFGEYTIFGAPKGSKLEKFLVKMMSSVNYPETSKNDAKRLLDAFGILSKNSKGKKVNWTGKHLHLAGLSGDEIFHEIAHWIIAAKERRFTPEFGLGLGFSTSDSEYANKFKKLSTKNADFEEYCTCILSAIWECKFGRNAIKGLLNVNFISYYNDDNTFYFDDKNLHGSFSKICEKCIQFLIDNHLITEDFQPIYAVRI